MKSSPLERLWHRRATTARVTAGQIIRRLGSCPRARQVDGAVAGMLAVADPVKPSTAAALAGLRRLGLGTVLLSGGNPATAEAVGAAVGVDEVIAEVLPADKQAEIERLQRGPVGR